MSAHDSIRSGPPERRDGQPPALGEALRALADDEATPEHLAAIDAAPIGREAVDHALRAERALRAATARCMGASCPPCPADLRDRVLSAARVEASTPAPSALRFVRRNWSLATAAAIVLLALGAVLALPVLAPNRGVWPPDQAARAELVAFLGGEHNACSASAYADAKLTIRDRVAAAAFLAQWVDDPDTLLAAPGPGYTFLGAGPCGVPGEGASAHIVFVPTDPSRARLSVFLQDASARDPRSLPRTLASLGETADGQAVRAVRRGGCVVYVVANSENAATEAAESLRAPG